MKSAKEEITSCPRLIIYEKRKFVERCFKFVVLIIFQSFRHSFI